MSILKAGIKTVEKLFEMLVGHMGGENMTAPSIKKSRQGIGIRPTSISKGSDLVRSAVAHGTRKVQTGTRVRQDGKVVPKFGKKLITPRSVEYAKDVAGVVDDMRKLPEVKKNEQEHGALRIHIDKSRRGHESMTRPNENHIMINTKQGDPAEITAHEIGHTAHPDGQHPDQFRAEKAANIVGNKGLDRYHRKTGVGPGQDAGGMSAHGSRAVNIDLLRAVDQSTGVFHDRKDPQIEKPTRDRAEDLDNIEKILAARQEIQQRLGIKPNQDETITKLRKFKGLDDKNNDQISQMRNIVKNPEIWDSMPSHVKQVIMQDTERIADMMDQEYGPGAGDRMIVRMQQSMDQHRQEKKKAEKDKRSGVLSPIQDRSRVSPSEPRSPHARRPIPKMSQQTLLKIMDQYGIAPPAEPEEDGSWKDRDDDEPPPLRSPEPQPGTGRRMIEID
jgi:hypothetical protein